MSCKYERGREAWVDATLSSHFLREEEAHIGVDVGSLE
jgi:hypothetical protein